MIMGISEESSAMNRRMKVHAIKLMKGKIKEPPKKERRGGHIDRRLWYLKVCRAASRTEIARLREAKASVRAAEWSAISPTSVMESKRGIQLVGRAFSMRSQRRSKLVEMMKRRLRPRSQIERRTMQSRTNFAAGLNILSRNLARE